MGMSLQPVNFSGARRIRRCRCGHGGTDHGMERVAKGLQAKAIGGGAVEDDEDLGSSPKCCLNFCTAELV